MKININHYATELDVKDEEAIAGMIKDRMLKILGDDAAVAKAIGEALTLYEQPLLKYIIPIIKKALIDILDTKALKLTVTAEDSEQP